MQSPTYQHQPFKSLYLLYEALTIAVVRIPQWIWYSLPKDKRPRPSWSLERVVRVNLLKNRPYVIAKTGLWWHEPDHTKLETGHGIKGVWVEPTPHLIIGDVKKWAVQADVEPMRIPGYWLDKEGYDTPVGAPRKPGEKVLYVLHGGGYTRLSGHPNDEVANVARGILKHTGPAMRRAFSLEFRLTKDPGTKPYFPFPAALIDAVAAYSYLIHDVGFTPQDIILEGDSAGGHLAISLVRYLVENRAGDATFIPLPPSSLILASPWVDLGPAPSDPSSSAQANIPSDHLNIANRGTQVLISHICGPLGRSAAVTNRYISPASTAATMEPMSFAGFPRTCIIAGGAEVSLDQIRVLHQKMKADLRSDLVKYIEMPDAIHDFLTKLWYEPERTECLRILGEWIEAGYEDTPPVPDEQQYHVPKSRL